MLDSDLAKLYECANGTKTINLAFKRHINRFPERFMFQLTYEEYGNLRFQVETANNMSRTLPYVFTEQGVAMLATILSTKKAEEVNIKNFYEEYYSKVPNWDLKKELYFNLRCQIGTLNKNGGIV